MDISIIDLIRMEKVTGIPITKIRTTLEKEDFDEEPKSTNFVEAREEFAATKHDSVKRVKFFIHWIVMAKSLRELQEVYGHSVSGTYEKKLIIEKMADFFTK